MMKGRKMASFAVIENGIVTNTIEAESKENAESVTGHLCVPFTEEQPAIIGLGWNETDGFQQKPVMTIKTDLPVIIE